MTVEWIGVPFDGFGRSGHQAEAAAVLREVGFAGELAGQGLMDRGELDLPPGRPERGAQTSLLNEIALVAMTQAVGERVSTALTDDHFPLVVGADCSTLLGTVPALRRRGTAGLLFVDGHEDTMPLDVSEDGEAANTEIGLLLGLTGRLLRGPLAEELPALTVDELAVLGPRDEAWRHQFNVGSLRDQGVWLRDWREVAAEPERLARAAVGHLQRHASPWWLHVDLDVLDPVVFPAQGLPDVADDPDGLTWDQLTRVLVAAVAGGGCLGWSLAIYDPDQDPDRTSATQIITLISAVLDALPRDPNRYFP